MLEIMFLFQCIVVLGSSGALVQEWKIKVTIATSGSKALAITNRKRNLMPDSISKGFSLAMRVG